MDGKGAVRRLHRPGAQMSHALPHAPPLSTGRIIAADLDMAAGALMGAAYGSAGERCMAVSVAVPVTDKVADALIERLVPQINALKIGPAADPALRRCDWRCWT